MTETGTWTLDTLRTHLETLAREREARYEQSFAALKEVLAAQQRECQAQIASLHQQIEKAEQTTERRFDSVNTARRVGDDLTRQLMPRMEAVQRDDALNEKIGALAARVDGQEGRSRGLNAGWSYLAVGIGALASIATMVYAITRIAAASP